MEATTTLAGDQIRTIRTRLGFSQDDFASLFKTTSMTIYRWEIGATKPKSASKVILEAMHEFTTQKSDAQLKRLLAGFVVALGLLILLQILFDFGKSAKGVESKVHQLSKL